MNDQQQPQSETDDPGDSMHVQIVLDRSGSMDPIAAATVDGLNGFLAKQRKVPGMLRLSLADFDSQEPFRVVADAIPIAEMRDLTEVDFQPRGGTPLFDAIGLAIERCDKRAEEWPNEDQVLVILTDGQENASTDFTGPQIASLLEARQEAGWAVLYLGANQDSFATGASLKMQQGNVRDFLANNEGVAGAISLASDAITYHRSAPSSVRNKGKDSLFDNAPSEQPSTPRRRS